MIHEKPKVVTLFDSHKQPIEIRGHGYMGKTQVIIETPQNKRRYPELKRRT